MSCSGGYFKLIAISQTSIAPTEQYYKNFFQRNKLCNATLQMITFSATNYVNDPTDPCELPGSMASFTYRFDL